MQYTRSLVDCEAWKPNQLSQRGHKACKIVNENVYLAKTGRDYCPKINLSICVIMATRT